MEIEQSTRDGCIVVTLSGRINLFTAPRIQRALLKQLNEQPFGIICDLAGVDALDPVCATIFSTVANHPSSRWPATSFLLCGAQPAVAEVLDRAQVPHFLPLYETVEEAVDQAFARPPYLRDELRLAPTPTAPAAARRFVGEVLQYWRLALPDQDVIARAQLLADELVTNAVVHARTAVRLRIMLRGVTGYTSRCRTAALACCAWCRPIWRATADAACGWSSRSPGPGACIAAPTAARSCGASSTSDRSSVDPTLPAGWGRPAS